MALAHTYHRHPVDFPEQTVIPRTTSALWALALWAAPLAAQHTTQAQNPRPHADTVFIFLDSAGNPAFIRTNFVTMPPKLLASPPPTYPDLYRQAGVQGRVVVEAVDAPRAVSTGTDQWAQGARTAENPARLQDPALVNLIRRISKHVAKVLLVVGHATFVSMVGHAPW